MAGFRFGNAGTSSLLKSAQSAQKAQASLNDQQQAFAWEFGPQDQQARDQYQQYIQGRVKTLQNSNSASDLEKSISFQRATIQVDRTFRTQQIQQATVGILEGNYSEQQKADLLSGLTKQAYDNGDIQNAESIRQMYDNQVIKMQNQQQALQQQAVAGAKTAQNALAAQYRGDENRFKNALDNVENQFQSGKMTQQDYVRQAGPIYQALNTLYQSAAQDDGLRPDQQLGFDTQFQNLQKSPNYDTLGSPEAIQRLQQGDTLKVTTDVNTGQRKLAFNNVTGQTVGPDGRMHNIVQVSPSPDQLQASLKSSGKADYVVTKPGEFQQESVFRAGNDNNLGYYIDPNTGRKIFVNAQTGEHRLADPNNPDQNPFTIQPDAPTSAVGVIKADLGKAGNSPITQGLGRLGLATLGTVISPLGGIAGNLASNLLDMSANQQRIAKAAQQKAAFEAAAARQAAEAKVAQQQLASAQAAQAVKAPSPVYTAYNPKLVSQPNTQVFSNYNFNPNQSIAQQLPFKNAQTDQQSAINLGTASGYNPNFLAKPF